MADHMIILTFQLQDTKSERLAIDFHYLEFKMTGLRNHPLFLTVFMVNMVWMFDHPGYKPHQTCLAT